MKNSNMGGGKSPELVALENQLLELAKTYQTFIAEATQKAVADFAPHQKAVGLLMPKIVAANKGEKVVFTAEEQATLKNAAVAAKQFQNASGLFTPKNLAALATQINNAKGIQAAANKYAKSDEVIALKKDITTFKSLGLDCPFKPDPIKLAKATKMAEDFLADKSITPIFTAVDKKALVEDLIKQLNSPCDISNAETNLCGPTAFCVVWAQRNPEEYAKAVLDMYSKGYAKCGNIIFEANEAMYEKPESKGLSPADYILLPAIRHSENVLSYEPLTDVGMRRALGITTPFEMAFWLNNIEWTMGGYESIPRINSYFNKNSSVILLVDSTRFSSKKELSKKSSVESHKKTAGDFGLGAVFGDHYVVLADEIKLIDEVKFSVSVLTWGKLKTHLMTEAEFESSVKRVWITNQKLTWTEIFEIDALKKY